jgi:hypothetical protein
MGVRFQSCNEKFKYFIDKPGNFLDKVDHLCLYHCLNFSGFPSVMLLFRIWNPLSQIIRSICVSFYRCWVADHLCILCVQVLGRELLLHLADHLFTLCVQVLGRELLLHLADHLLPSVYRCLVGSCCYIWLTTCLPSVYRCWVGSCCYTWLTTCFSSCVQVVVDRETVPSPGLLPVLWNRNRNRRNRNFLPCGTGTGTR